MSDVIKRVVRLCKCVRLLELLLNCFLEKVISCELSQHIVQYCAIKCSVTRSHLPSMGSTGRLQQSHNLNYTSNNNDSYMGFVGAIRLLSFLAADADEMFAGLIEEVSSSLF